MKRFKSIVIAVAVVIVLASVVMAGAPQMMTKISTMPLAFTENQGQWDEKVLFRADAGRATMWFTQDGAVYQFTQCTPKEATDNSGPPQPAVGSERFDREPESVESIAIKASFIGANAAPQMVGQDPMEYKCNYFIGSDPNEWHKDVSNYNAIVYEDIYSGIDLKYYGNGKQMEYDFIVSPGADPSQISIQYEGIKSLSVNADGELVIETEWGEVIEQRPVIYQIQDGVRKTIEGEYLLAGGNSFGFSLGSGYSPELPLVIDPILSYSTYLGGS